MELKAGITDLAITFANALGPPGFHRVTNIHGAGANINRGTERIPTYVWYKEGGGDPITDIIVRSSESDCEPEYEKCGKIINRGYPDECVVLCKKNLDERPIKELRIVHGDEKPPPSFIFNHQTWISSKATAKLCFRRMTDEECMEERWSPLTLKMGDVVEVKDIGSRWCLAHVIAVDEGTVVVRFGDGKNQQDESIPTNSKRLAKPGTNTGRPHIILKQQGKAWDARLEEIEEMAGRVRDLCKHERNCKDEEMLLGTELSSFLEKCLSSKISKRANQHAIQVLLQLVLSLVVRAMERQKPLSQHYLKLLRQILGSDPKTTWFYAEYGYDLPSEHEESSATTGVSNKNANYARIVYNLSERKPIVSPYFVSNVNHFGRLQGFERVLERLRKRCYSLDEVDTYVRIVFLQSKHYTIQFAKEFCQKFARYFLHALIQIVESDVEGDRIDLDRMMLELEAISLSTERPIEISQLLETFSLDITRPYLHSTFISHRMRAVSQLGVLIEMVRRRDVPRPFVKLSSAVGGSENTTPLVGRNERVFAACGTLHNLPKTVKWLTKDYVAEWLVQEKIIELILGNKESTLPKLRVEAHDEIIKRAVPIFEFLIAERKFNESHITALWHAIKCQQNSHSHEMYKVLIDVVAKIPWSLVEHVHQLLCGLPRSITSSEVELIRSFSLVSAMRQSKLQESHELGIELLWECVQDYAPVSTTVKREAEAALCELLCKPVFRSQLSNMMHLCVKCLQARCSVTQSLRILHHLLERCSDPYVHGKTVSETIKELEAQYQLMDLLVEELNDMATNIPKTFPVCDERGCMTNLDNHDEGLVTRLQLLLFLLQSSSSSLPYSSIEKFWNAFVGSSTHSREAELFFDWFHQALYHHRSPAHGGRNAIVGPKVLEQVFVSLFCSREKTSLASLRQNGFSCFKRMFILVNIKRKTISESGAHLTGFIVHQDKLIGIESLWELALTVHSRATFGMAADLLILCYLHVSAQLSLEAVWTTFLSRSMSIVENAVSQKTSEDLKVERILNLIVGFIHATERYRTRQLARLEDNHENLVLKVIYTNKKQRPATSECSVICKRSDTVGLLRYKIGLECGHPSDHLRLINHKRTNLSAAIFDTISIEKAGLGSYLEAVALERPESDTAGHQARRYENDVEPKLLTDFSFVKQMLIKTKRYFDILYELLSASLDVSAAAWNVLSLIPKNEELATKLRTLQDECAPPTTEWAELLSANCPEKLLYQLEIMRDILSFSSDTASGSSWLERFIAVGGVKYLVSLVLDFPLKNLTSSNLRLESLRLLLSLTNQIMRKNSASVDVHKLGQHMLAILRSVCQQFIHSMSSAKEIQISTTSPGDQLLMTSCVDKTNDFWTALDLFVLGSQITSSGGVILRRKPTSTSNNEDSEVISEAFQLLIFCAHCDSQLLPIIDNFPQLDTIVGYGLIQAPSRKLRKTMVAAIAELCDGKVDSLNRTQLSDKIGPQSLVMFLPRLMRILPFLYENENHISEYFELVCCLIKNLISPLKANMWLLVETLIQNVLQHPVLEATANDQDLILRGLLRALTLAFASMPRSLITTNAKDTGSLEQFKVQTGVVHSLLEQCLFAIPIFEQGNVNTIAPPKCKSSESRACAYALFLQMAKFSDNVMRDVCHYLVRYHPLTGADKTRDVKRDRRPQKSLGNALRSKSDTGFVGMKNLGNTCYMNSTLQQFFMLHDFRRKVLAANYTPEEGSVLYQLQTLFAHLQESERHHHNPKSLLETLRDWEGVPIDVTLQQDASEFLTNLFQQLETELTGSPEANLMRQAFGGVFSNELIGPDQKYSEREEPFYFISLQVKHRTTLQASLDSWVAGETVDYTWETSKHGQVYRQSVETQKRISIKDLPQHLIIHLKRFEFDFDTMQQRKLNDRFEFPLHINMHPYCKEGRMYDSQGSATIIQDSKAPEYYEYSLAGVVVHMGTANSGHYYSLIKDRALNASGEDCDRWFIFDDTEILPFDMTNFEAECFGGQQDLVRQSSAYTSEADKSVRMARNSYSTKAKNALLLFYDRKEVRESPLSHERSQDLDDYGIEDKLKSLSLYPGLLPKSVHASHLRRRRQLSYRARVANKAILDAVWEENKEYWRRKNIYDKKYVDFLSNLQEQIKSSPPNAAVVFAFVQLSVPFVFLTCSQLFDAQVMNSWVLKLTDAIASSYESSKWLLAAFSCKPNLAQELYDMSPANAHALRYFLSAAISCTARHQPLPDPENPREDYLFIDKIALSQWNSASDQDFRKLALLWIGEFARGSESRRLYVFGLGMASACLEEIERTSYQTSGMVQKAPELFLTFSDMFLTFARINLKHQPMSRSHYAGELEQEGLLKEQGAKILLDPTVMHYFIRSFISSIVGRELQKLLECLCRDSTDNSTVILDCVLTGINVEDGQQLKPLFRCLKWFLAIDDNLQPFRVARCLPKLTACMAKNQRYYKATEVSSTMLLRIVQSNEKVRDWVWCHPSALQWLLVWGGKPWRSLTPAALLLKSTDCSTVKGSSEPPSSKALSYININMLALLNQQRIALPCWDSDDDPENLVSRRIIVKWAGNKWYKGSVQAYDEQTGMHFIRYDDGDEKTYKLAEKEWVFEKEEDLTSTIGAVPSVIQALTRLEPKL